MLQIASFQPVVGKAAALVANVTPAGTSGDVLRQDLHVNCIGASYIQTQCISSIHIVECG